MIQFRQRSRKSFIFLLTCFAFWLHAIASLIAQENYEVSVIEFTGNKSFSSSELLEQIAMYGTSGFKKSILKRKSFLYSKEIAESDRERLVNFYQREGFLFISVMEIDLESNKKKKEVKIGIKIVEGKPILVNDVHYFFVPGQTIDNQSDFEKIIDDIRSSLLLVNGKRFRDQAIQLDRELLSEKFRNSGYPYNELKPELTVDSDNCKVDISWQIESGPKCIFGEVVVNGNERVETSLIFEQLAFKKGQLFQQELIDKSQRQVYALGMFYIATVTAVLNEERRNTIPVQIQIKEAPGFTAKFGVGYGREDRVRLFSDLQRLGFLGGARRLNLFAKHSALEPYRIDAKLSQPITHRTTFLLNPYLINQDEPGFAVNRYGGGLSVLHKIAQHTNGSIGYTFERVDLDKNSVQDVGKNNNLESLYNKSSVSFGLTRDTANPLFTPASGMFGTLIVTVSGLGLNSEYHFTKIILDLRRYRQITEGLIFAARIKLGTIQSHDDSKFVPVEERFFSGGTSSIRGWPRSELGPRTENGSPIGGKSLVEGSVEFRYPIWGLVSGVVFSDFGNVWVGSSEYKADGLRYALGCGLRVATPIGPIRLDIARPVYDEDDKLQFYISVGHSF